jgi:hypothetical protein
MKLPPGAGAKITNCGSSSGSSSCSGSFPFIKYLNEEIFLKKNHGFWRKFVN